MENNEKVSVKGKYIDADKLLSSLPDDLPYKASVNHHYTAWDFCYYDDELGEDFAELKKKYTESVS